MAVSHQDRLIVFTNYKHELLISKFGKRAESYFVRKDIKSIEKLSEDTCEIIWNQLEKNIKNGHFGLSRKTCTFCIHDSLVTKHCARCEWSKNHGHCSNKRGDFQKLEKYLNKNDEISITSKEYKNIIKMIKEEIK